jgi:hypothetical protein
MCVLYRTYLCLVNYLIQDIEGENDYNESGYSTATVLLHNMRILVSTQGPYGERIARNLRENAPRDWSIEEIALPRALPNLIDDPDEFLPETIPQADLLVAAGESTGAAQLIIDLVERSGARSVVAPVDNSAWLPQGLANQLKRELAEKNIAIAFPKPFCSLTEASYGYRGSAQPYEDEPISSFARFFGRPKLKITVNPETRLIEQVEVERDSACGSVAHRPILKPGLSSITTPAFAQ